MKVFGRLFVLCLILLILSCSQPGIEFIPDTIVIYGDTRTNYLIHYKVVSAILKIKPVAVFHVGDLVDDGWNPDEWKICNTIISELINIADFYPALGNHEKNSPFYFQNFDLPNNEIWYSLNINDIHFIVLDSNRPVEPGSEQYEWLEQNLKDTEDSRKFKIAVFHHPPYSSGPHREDEKGLRHTIVPLFEKYGVDMVFNGHDHIYERSLVNNIYYIVTAGGGAPLYNLSKSNPYRQVFKRVYHFCRLSVVGNRLNVDVFSKNLEIIDHFSVTK